MEAEMTPHDDLPLALRRPRRSNAGIHPKREAQAAEEANAIPIPEFKTPRKRKARFSAPELSSCTGLTPMIRRTTICATPSSSSSRRRASTGTASSLHRRVSTPTSLRRQAPSAPTTSRQESSCLHHTVDGRVERRLRRSAVRSQMQKLTTAHQRSEQQSRSEIAQLRAELHERAREVYELQNATIVVDTDRVCELESMVDELQTRLREVQRPRQLGRSMSSSSERTSLFEWTRAARDPYADWDEDVEMRHESVEENGNDDEMFGETSMAQMTCGTPTKIRTAAESSFMTPPLTSPQGPPSSPSRFRGQTDGPVTIARASTGVQAELVDLEQQMRIESLQREMDKLTASLDTYKNLVERLDERVPRIPDSEDADDSLEPRIEHVLRTLSDRTAALTTLTSSVSSLGFLGTDADEMLASIAAGFRTARLELEYLTPGEITLPLTSHGAEVLDLLLERLRELAKKAREGDDAVDEYHAIELNLLQQLKGRVEVMDELRAEVQRKQGELAERAGEVENLTVGNDRLKGAVEGYIRDIRELERLVETMEAEAAGKDVTVGERDATVADLEERLAAVTSRASDLQDELEVAQATRKKQLASVNRRSGDALALRDARVAELREEIDRINAALRDAHDTIRGLRVGGKHLEEENSGLRAVVDGMRAELEKAEKLRLGEAEHGQQQQQAGNYLAGGSARRVGLKKRRRPDSGLGLVDEDVIDD